MPQGILWIILLEFREKESEDSGRWDTVANHKFLLSIRLVSFGQRHDEKAGNSKKYGKGKDQSLDEVLLVRRQEFQQTELTESTVRIASQRQSSF